MVQTSILIAKQLIILWIHHNNYLYHFTDIRQLIAIIATNILINKHLNVNIPAVGHFSFRQLAVFHSGSWLFFIPTVGRLGSITNCMCKVVRTYKIPGMSRIFGKTKSISYGIRSHIISLSSPSWKQKTHIQINCMQVQMW